MCLSVCACVYTCVCVCAQECLSVCGQAPFLDLLLLRKGRDSGCFLFRGRFLRRVSSTGWASVFLLYSKSTCDPFDCCSLMACLRRLDIPWVRWSVCLNYIVPDDWTVASFSPVNFFAFGLLTICVLLTQTFLSCDYPAVGLDLDNLLKSLHWTYYFFFFFPPTLILVHVYLWGVCVLFSCSVVMVATTLLPVLLLQDTLVPAYLRQGILVLVYLRQGILVLVYLW